MKSGAVIYVKDLDRMQSFYEACFHMEVADRAREYCVLESESWTLSLVKMPAQIAASIVVSVPPARREEVPIKLAFTVDGIDVLRTRFAEFGGVLDSTTSQWEFRGGVHCDGVDPEGNVLQLVERVRTDG
jgi:predicted enzyme related to lactoylglutathione lyase